MSEGAERGHGQEPGMLEGLTVVEVAGEIAGPFAARILCDLGARCIKVEPPAGDPSRQWGPFPANRPDPEASAAFFAFNYGKESVVLDLEMADDMDQLYGLLERAHVLIESGQLAIEPLRARFPGLVIVSVTPFGRAGSAAGRPATEAVAYAFGGAMSSTGLPDRLPHYLGGNLVQAQAGNAAACAAMAGVMSAENDGEGQWIDIAWVEVEAGGVDRAAPYLLGTSYCGVDATREAFAHSGLPSGTHPCADGHVVVSMFGWTIVRMLDTIADPELDAALRGNLGNIYRPAGRDAINKVLPAWFNAHTRAEITEAAQSHGWAVTPVNGMLAVSDDPILREAQAVETVAAGALGTLTIPGPSFQVPGGPAYRGPAPRLGEHTEAILAELRGPGESP